MTDDFTFDVIKNDIENISNKNKTFEKTYLILIGLTFSFIFFFAFPYYSLVDVKSILIDITNSINQINSDTNNLKTYIQSQFNTSSLENPNKIPNENSTLLNTELPKLTYKLEIIELKIKNLAQKIPIDNNNLSKFITESEKIRRDINNYAQSDTQMLNPTNLNNLENLLTNITKYNYNQTRNVENNIQKLIHPIENLETPLGKILLNFTYLILIFPLALSIGFSISLFQLHDILRLRHHFAILYGITRFKNTEEITGNLKGKITSIKKTVKENPGIDDLPTFLEERMSFLINPHNRLHMVVILIIPTIIFAISIVIDAIILDMEKIHTLPSLSIHTAIITFIIGGITLGIGIYVTLKRFKRRRKHTPSLKYKSF